MGAEMEETSALAKRAINALVATVWSLLGHDADHHDNHHQERFQIICLHQHQLNFVHILKHWDTSVFVAPVSLHDLLAARKRLGSLR